MAKILGIDHGNQKIGLAIGDARSPTGVPWRVIINDHLLMEKLLGLIKSEEVEKIVVGWPLNMKGEASGQTKIVGRFIEQLKSRTDLEIIQQDERLSSVEAGRHGQDDAVAAMYILQTYLDSQNG